MEDQILRNALAPGGGCPSIEELGRYADGALASGEEATAAHIRGCLNCQAELALMRAVTSTRVERTFRVASLPLAAVAAVVLVGVAASSFFFFRSAPELPANVTTADEVVRSLAIAVRQPVGDQAEAPSRFEWVAVDRAIRYRVRLMEVDRREVWSASTTEPRVDLPAQTQSLIRPASTMVWDVTAYNAAGAAIAESGPQSFRVISR
jgi:hypothetical protein